MPSSIQYSCPVCGFDRLSEPPYDKFGDPSFEICPSCGTEFGYQDARKSHAELRQRWLQAGATWDSKVEKCPEGWNPLTQLKAAGLDVKS
jgi:hypothetical protein